MLMGLDLLNLSPELRARLLRDNPEECAKLAIAKAAQVGFPLLIAPAPSKPEDALNKTERAYLVYARSLPDTKVWAQQFGLRLSGLGGDRCFYYPDFALLDKDGLRFVDTKAVWRDGKVHVEDDALVKLKWASQVYAPLPFLIAWQIHGVWHHKRISPGSKL
jgi:hypothetical protein